MTAKKRKQEAADSPLRDHQSVKVAKAVDAREPNLQGAAAAGAATAAAATAAAGKAAAKAARKAAKELLAAQIDAKQKLLKLLQKVAAQKDPAKKALLQQKVTKLQQKIDQLEKLLPGSSTAPGAVAATAAAAAAQPTGAKAAGAAVAAANGSSSRFSYHRVQPLAGITSVLANTPAEQARRAERQQRFAADLAALKSSNTTGSDKAAAAGSSIADQFDVGIGDAGGWLRLEGGYGKSRALEKEYLRLTAVPKAEDVRPPEVLVEALALMKRRWREGCSYAYACSQLKAIRQDLTVQGVADELARDAYETHGRVALESNDLPEFRQCLARLKQLYRAGVHGSAPEFYAYGVLHAAALGPLMLSQELGQLPRCHLDHPALVHALATVSAVRSGQYTRFMSLYASAPRMAPYLMDQLLPRMRAAGLSTMLLAYHPLRLPLGWAMTQLGYGEDQEEEALAYFAEHGVVVDMSVREIDTKASRAAAAAAAAAAGGSSRR